MICTGLGNALRSLKTLQLSCRGMHSVERMKRKSEVVIGDEDELSFLHSFSKLLADIIYGKGALYDKGQNRFLERETDRQTDREIHKLKISLLSSVVKSTECLFTFSPLPKRD